MFSKIKESVRANLGLAIITFEIFWIVIFLLDRFTGSGSGGGVPQFVYVNF